jgi:hypothetical protein
VAKNRKRIEHNHLGGAVKSENSSAKKAAQNALQHACAQACQAFFGLFVAFFEGNASC